jgi:dTDP-4-amino-4,6-dideoxygalactose transaminase
VLTVPNTFIATGEAITQAGAACRFVDIDPQTSNISIEALTRYLESDCRRDDKTGLPVERATGLPIKAIVPVHLYGQMANMEAIVRIAEVHGLIVIEDACQAHGAECLLGSAGWKRAGSIGKAAAFSFYPAKNLGACGEAGAVTTNDDEVAAKIRMIRDHGQRQKYFHAMEGYNGRLDAIQAGFLSVKLRSLASGNANRVRLAKRYDELLQNEANVVVPFEPEWSHGVYHLYVIKTPLRNELQAHLTQKGVGTGLHYPLPLHLQDAYTHLGYKKGDFPVCEAAACEILSLPMYPQLSQAQQDIVVAAIKQFCADAVAVV